MRATISKIISFAKKPNCFAVFIGFYLFVCLPLFSVSTVVLIPGAVTKGLLVILFLLFLFCLPGLYKRIVVVDLVVVCLYLGLALFSFVFYENNRASIIAGLKVFVTSLWIYYVVFRFGQENKRCVLAIEYGALVNAVMLCVVSIASFKMGKPENMTLCYESLFFASLCMSTAFIQKRICIKTIVFGVGAIAGVASILLFGSRGPVLLFSLQLVAFVLLKTRKTKLGKPLLFLLLLAVALFVLVPAISWLSYNGDNDISIKILRFYGKAFSLSGRDYLYLLELNGLRYSPIVGNGLFGDRFLSIGFIFSNPNTTNFGLVVQSPYTTYAHSIVIELLVSLGVPLFLLLAVFGALFFAKYVFPPVVRSFGNCHLIIPLFVTGFLSLFLSNSFAISNYFWGFVGCCIFLFVNKSNTKDFSMKIIRDAYYEYQI